MSMSFSSDCKEELCRLPLEKSCCRLSELSALYMTLGSLSLLGRGQVKVQFAVESPAIARRIFVLLQRELHLTAQIHYVTHARFGGVRSCILTLSPQQSPVLLTRLSMMDLDHHGQAALRSTTPRVILQKSCCCRSFLRGAMLGCGTLTKPKRGYRLELVAAEEGFRLVLAKAFHLSLRQSQRKGQTIFYQTTGEQVITFLTLIGAHQAVMTLEDLRVQREVLGDINRAMNCDAANLQKLMNASDRQIEQILRLISHEGFGRLSPALQEIAKARVHAPDASLAELGQMLDPPLGKSGVNHRMRRLMEIAESLPLPNRKEKDP
jgi:DNA-binding protein WhiA